MKSKLYIIIGGGIIGGTIARELLLREYGEVTILEKEENLGEHASGRNSGVIHSGINQKPGSLKARMCLDGSKRVREYSKKNNVKMEECGTLVVARNKSEEHILNTILDMGFRAGVIGLKIIDKEELNYHEPNVTGHKALLSPSGAVVDSVNFLKTIARENESLGAIYKMNTEVIGIVKDKIITNNGDFNADYIINCAGLYSDKIAHMMNVGLEYIVVPFRGEYMEVKNIKVNSMVYQVPDLKYPFLGVHLTKTLDNKVMAGPTAIISFGRESYNKEFNFEETFQMIKSKNFRNLFLNKEFLNLVSQNMKISISKKKFLDEIKILCPEVQKNDLVPYRSGIRAQIVDNKGKMLDDILIRYTDRSVHILNAVSPGMTCSLAFAEYMVDNIPKL